MRSYVQDGTVKAFELWDPGKLGQLAAYTAVALASGQITGAQGQSFTAGPMGNFTIGAQGVITLGAPTVFDSSNISQFNF
jgi:rhamnose transport system substrate-binding protein